MTLRNTLNFLGDLVTKTSKKSEIKVYQEFIQIIGYLEKKELTETEVQAIEAELDTLNLDSALAPQRKQLKKALQHFKAFLKETYSLTSEGYYTNMGVGLGSSFGIVFGLVILSGFERSLGLSVGIGIGMMIGLIIGRKMDAQAKASGKMI